ncbi:peptide-methionine (R)-S-oxide reductase MsrB [Terriglobus saanensis]|uniref:peptide-methionine (R)-S-oxide reductase n=1 Tax=Terriglobus saanensis (strain ATCC BAA-1853 / DSM 23119 / SP1PR4) TaxID=401053 RepID=E8V2H3_TERSS|nr:peptide-methionine (R)-S-oxide reductase MsrB [Terriglobus saanensis]ADV82391.1 methionine-R-sulfoxide reductase [Terriglobus saanensis SP1PR4]
MSEFLKQSEETASREAAVKIQTRRTFLATSAAAVGALAVWSLRKPLIAAAAGGKRDSLPATVTIIDFASNGKPTGKVTVPTVSKPDAEWKHELSSISYEVARHEGTERPYTGNSWDLHDRGLFRCICCDTALFSSDTKFDSGTGWPSFWQVLAKENVVEKTDSTLGMERTEVSCKRCAAHLGHVFDDGPRPTGLRYCMNSASMRFAKLA